MKEASGEANLTVVAIILIGIVAAVATPLITNMIESSRLKSCCIEAGGGKIENGNCVDDAGKTYTMDESCTSNKK